MPPVYISTIPTVSLLTIQGHCSGINPWCICGNLSRGAIIRNPSSRRARNDGYETFVEVMSASPFLANVPRASGRNVAGMAWIYEDAVSGMLPLIPHQWPHGGAKSNHVAFFPNPDNIPSPLYTGRLTPSLKNGIGWFVCVVGFW